MVLVGINRSYLYSGALATISLIFWKVCVIGAKIQDRVATL